MTGHVTLAEGRWATFTRHRRREILRSREEFCRLFFDDPAPAGAARTLREYFLRFALLARRRP